MTKGDVIRMACEAYGNWYPPITSEMEHFANLIANAVREECAEICDKKEDVLLEDKKWNEACRSCATAIRGQG